MLLTRRLVRRGSIAGADQLLGWLESSVTDDIRVSVARARLLEWRRRDPRGALSVVEAARRRMPDEATGLDGRHARLLRKVQPRSVRPKKAVRPLQLEAPIGDASR